MGEMITKGNELYNKHEMRNDEKVEIMIKGNDEKVEIMIKGNGNDEKVEIIIKGNGNDKGK